MKSNTGEDFLFKKTKKKQCVVCLVFIEAASCPLVEGLALQDPESSLQLLCAPSQHRTDILVWICSR